MTEYHVEYRIEVEAESPEAAARKVAAILTYGGAERGVYHVRKHNHAGAGVEFAEVEIDLEDIDEDRVCQECEEEVTFLSSDNLCDGCVEYLATTEVCPNCGERVPKGEMNHWPGLKPPVSMCNSCEHNARRSGWEPGQEET